MFDFHCDFTLDNVWFLIWFGRFFRAAARGGLIIRRGDPSSFFATIQVHHLFDNNTYVDMLHLIENYDDVD